VRRRDLGPDVYEAVGVSARNDALVRAAGLAAALLEELRALQQEAALEQALADAGQDGAWFAMKARLQSIEGDIDEIGSLVAGELEGGPA
jgi:hypothetical protein